MATTNPVITTSWAKIVTAGDEFTLGVSPGPIVQIAIACQAADEAPTVAGQALQAPSEAINRALTGPGYLFAKSLTGASVTAWLHSWTP